MNATRVTAVLVFLATAPWVGAQSAAVTPVRELHASCNSCSQPAVMQVVVPQAIWTGSLLRVVMVIDPPIASAQVSLRDEATSLARASAFRANGQEPIWAALLGVPDWLDGGGYRLHVEATGTDGGRLVFEERLTVHARRFAEVRITLDSALTTLRSDTSPQRRAQQESLGRLLATARLDAVYHTAALRLPVTLESMRRSSGYGDRRTFLYSNGTTAASTHWGVDLACPAGTAVHAPAAGKVVFAAERLVTGLTIVLEHLPGVYSLYYHLSLIGVSVDAMVAPGDLLGEVGSTGVATGPHLHWEVRAGQVPIDPDELLGAPLLDIPASALTIGVSQVSDPGGR